MFSSRRYRSRSPIRRNNSGSSQPSSHTRTPQNPEQPLTEREILLAKWRQNYCASNDGMIARLRGWLNQEEECKIIRSTPAEKYYQRQLNNAKITRGTEELKKLCESFEYELVERAARVNAKKPPYSPPPRKRKTRLCKYKSKECSSSDSSSSEDQIAEDEEDCTMEELVRKQQHPDRLHKEMWYNDPGEMNDGPLCRCSLKARKSGIRHGIYAGEKTLEKCCLDSNNADRLYHYRITITPPTNFLTKTPTIINHDDHEFIFEGFSMFSHFPLEKLPTCKVIRFNIKYTILYIEEKSSENFCIRELNLFRKYLQVFLTLVAYLPTCMKLNL